MRNLILLIIRYSAFILFVILEVFAFYLIVNNNKSQKEIWAHSSSLFTGSVYKQINKVEEYFDLNTKNDSLLNANATLQEKIINYRVVSKDNAFQKFETYDSISCYRLLPARVCNKTLNLRNNYFTLCKGKNHGIDVGMGVISDYGLVGIVSAVSDNFATVMLIINGRSSVSVSVKDKNFPGSLVWNNSDASTLNLVDIPKHANIQIGDSILTSGFSVSFPPDIYVGKISNFAVVQGSNNYKIEVDLDFDLSRVDVVYVIQYDFKDEKQNLIEAQNG